MTETSATRTAAVFTPESANRALPYVRAVVDDVVDAFDRLRRAEEIRARVMAGSPTTGATPEERDRTLRDAEDSRNVAREDLARVRRELEKVGVELKEPEIGLIDFPGEMFGRRVHLCWKKGEERVAWWHDVEDGFRGRRPLGAAGPGGGGPVDPRTAGAESGQDLDRAPAVPRDPDSGPDA